MKIVNRIYRNGKCFIYDFGRKEPMIEDLDLTQPDLYTITRNGLVRVDEDVAHFMIQENIFIHVSDFSEDFVALYMESPECKGRTYAWYDIFILDTNGQIVLFETKVDIGGASSSYFLDNMVLGTSEDEPAADLHVRKHVQTGHKTDEEYHATWHWDKAGIHKENWIFVGSNKGY